MEKEDDCKTQVMFLDSSMNSCAVNINRFQLKIDLQANGKSFCLCNHFKYPQGCYKNYYFVKKIKYHNTFSMILNFDLLRSLIFGGQ